MVLGPPDERAFVLGLEDLFLQVRRDRVDIDLFVVLNDHGVSNQGREGTSARLGVDATFVPG